jgi:hypothetical protein
MVSCPALFYIYLFMLIVQHNALYTSFLYAWYSPELRILLRLGNNLCAEPARYPTEPCRKLFIEPRRNPKSHAAPYYRALPKP